MGDDYLNSIVEEIDFPDNKEVSTDYLENQASLLMSFISFLGTVTQEDGVIRINKKYKAKNFIYPDLSGLLDAPDPEVIKLNVKMTVVRGDGSLTKYHNPEICKGELYDECYIINHKQKVIACICPTSITPVAFYNGKDFVGSTATDLLKRIEGIYKDTAKR